MSFFNNLKEIVSNVNKGLDVADDFIPGLKPVTMITDIVDDIVNSKGFKVEDGDIIEVLTSMSKSIGNKLDDCKIEKIKRILDEDC